MTAELVKRGLPTLRMRSQVCGVKDLALNFICKSGSVIQIILLCFRLFTLSYSSLFCFSYNKMAAKGETYYPAFPPSTKPHISLGLPFPEACAHHVTNTFQALKVYVIVSYSISKTKNFTRLQDALGDKIVGVRKGIKPHTPWDDIVEIVKDMQQKGVDLIITLGAGSLTDGAKIIKYVSPCIATTSPPVPLRLPGPSK